MADGVRPPQRVAVRPLTAHAFSPFGQVVAHSGNEPRLYLRSPLECDSEAIHPAFWVTRVSSAASLPLRIERLERHPHSAQTFIPLRGCEYLVVVAPSGAAGLPDLDGLKAFGASRHQGVTYRPGVWHHGLTALDAPAEFAVLIALTGRNDDDQFWGLPRPVDIVDARAASSPIDRSRNNQGGGGAL